MSEPTSESVKGARATVRPAPGPPRLLTPEEEKKIENFVALYADRQKFEQQYPGLWLSSANRVRDAANLLALHHRQEEERVREAERRHGTIDVDRQKDAERELESYNRGVDAIKSSG